MLLAASEPRQCCGAKRKKSETAENGDKNLATNVNEYEMVADGIDAAEVEIDDIEHELSENAGQRADI